MSVSQGVHGAGHRTYTDTHYRAVVQFVACGAPGEAITVAEISAYTGVPGRTVRQIVSDADGVEFVLGGDGNGGYQVAVDPDEAERLSNRFASQIRRMQERLDRRRALVDQGHLGPSQQLGLWEAS